MQNGKLRQQIDFIIEIDKLKKIYRRTKLISDSRYENDAEHSWHLAMMAMILHEHANEKIDLLKVLKLVLIHDLVEIDAGDTFAYDIRGREDKYEREDAAARRLFSILPEAQRDELYGLWQEFELRETIEAKFASALDSLQPLLHNYLNNGEIWEENHITGDMVYNRNKKIADGSEKLWEQAQEIIKNSIERGILKESL
jgi:putative hydrolase of HD superfamily